jgi:hypothetical protein
VEVRRIGREERRDSLPKRIRKAIRPRDTVTVADQENSPGTPRGSLLTVYLFHWNRRLPDKLLVSMVELTTAVGSVSWNRCLGR